ncbi:cytochrome c4 [Verminephrobacter eiseniae]|uniref:c-type cytochrome n=1 Tax=Verminephrobacter eiseniae TaxID=364317 RepID=UPI0022377B66|nr:cytochrome c4 [Verminephrobacter eiseniae]MCW5263228.1 cytochrome c4 [Verminephrobacter eiseniae]
MNKPLSTLSALAVVCMAALPPVQAQQVPGDAQAGKQKIAMCIGCHGIPGYQASFPEVHKVPMISGQSAKYISAALLAYQKGERKHPTMRGIAESLTDKDIADLSAYYEQHGKTGTEPPAKPRREPSAQVAELLKKGTCASCHGENFAQSTDPSYPSIAGQHADYLFVALKSYKIENNTRLGRGNAIMAGFAKQFSNAELKALAQYVGSLDSKLHTLPQPDFR